MTRHASDNMLIDRGMTLVELMMSLTIFSVIGLSVTMMLTAATQGTKTANDHREVSIQEKMLGTRVSSTIRGSYKILDAGDGYLVLWTADTRDTDTPNLSELVRIEYDSDTGRLSRYAAEFPDGWTDEQITTADTEYSLDSDFDAVTTTLKDGDYFVESLWSTSITQATFSLNHVTAQSATLASYQLAVTTESGSHTIMGAAALRAD